MRVQDKRSAGQNNTTREQKRQEGALPVDQHGLDSGQYGAGDELGTDAFRDALVVADHAHGHDWILF